MVGAWSGVVGSEAGVPTGFAGEFGDDGTRQALDEFALKEVNGLDWDEPRASWLPCGYVEFDVVLAD